jgi:hypothetical protein
MKKLLALFIVLSILVPAVFAEVTVGTWNDAQFKAVTYRDDDLSAGFDAAQSRLKLGYVSADGILGGDLVMRHRLFADAVANPDSSNITRDWGRFWVKPFGNDVLLIQIANVDITNLRLTIGDYDHWGNWSVQSKGNGWAMDGVGGQLGFAIKPITGLTAVLGFYDIGTDIYDNFRVGVGYAIPDLAHIRAQYVNIAGSAADGKGAIQAGFQFKPTDSGINVDLGLAYDFDKADGFKFSVATDDTFGDIAVKARFDGKLVDKSTTLGDAFVYNAHVQATYAIADFGKLVAGFGLTSDPADFTNYAAVANFTDDLAWGLVAGAQIPISVATFSAGISYGNLKGFMIPLRISFDL